MGYRRQFVSPLAADHFIHQHVTRRSVNGEIRFGIAQTANRGEWPPPFATLYFVIDDVLDFWVRRKRKDAAVPQGSRPNLAWSNYYTDDFASHQAVCQLRQIGFFGPSERR